MIYNSLLHWYTFIFDCLTISLLLFRPAACEAYIIDSVNISVIYRYALKQGVSMQTEKNRVTSPCFLCYFWSFAVAILSSNSTISSVLYSFLSHWVKINLSSYNVDILTVFISFSVISLTSIF